MASSFRKPNGFFKGFEITANDGSLMKPAVLFGVGNNQNQQLFFKKSNTYPTVVCCLFLFLIPAVHQPVPVLAGY
jgi:hypothetical protein